MRSKHKLKPGTLKIILLIAVAAISMLIIGVLLSYLQTRLYINSYNTEIENTFNEIPEMLEQAEEENQQNTEIFDQTYQALAESVVFISQTEDDFKINHGTMKRLQELFEVNNILIVSKDGEIRAEATGTYADFSSSRFNLLRTVFDEDISVSEAVEINTDDKDWHMRYYAAQLDDDNMVVVEQNPEGLNDLIEESGSERAIFGNVNIGESGYIFTVSARGYTVNYYPDEALEGVDALMNGLDVAALEDGFYGYITFNGVDLYCGIMLLNNTYYVAAVPTSDMAATRNFTVAVILIAFVAVMFVILMYGIFVIREEERKGLNPNDVRKVGPLRFNSSVARRASILAAVGFLAVVGVSFFMQTLFALSRTSVTNESALSDVTTDIDDSYSRAYTLYEEYGDSYLPICRAITYIIENQSMDPTRAELQDMADELGVQNIYIFNASGEVTLTNAANSSFTISENEEDQSYEFLSILEGTQEYVVQDPMISEGSTEYWQYVGCAMHNKQGLVNGMVQIGIRPVFLEGIRDVTSIDNVLKNVNMMNNGSNFAVNKADNTFAYYQMDEDYVGDSVTKHGIDEDKIKGDYNDYLTIDGVTYYASSAEVEDYYVYLIGPEGELMSERVPLTIAVGIVSLICILLIYLFLIWEPRWYVEETDAGKDSRTMDTEMPDGRTVRTESAASRWLNRSYKWNEKTAWQKMVTVLRWVIAGLMVIICLAVVFRDQIFSDDSIVAYVLSNKWERELNIFSITACIMIVCVVMTLVAIAQRALSIISTVLSARGETICRMLSSFLRYAALIGVIFYCLMLVGVDTTTLLASAGILSLAITFGAQSLVTDILSGLFIIFEGEFRVGDIIMVDDWRGTVLEIGIRTTKVQDGSQNVKVIRNGDINNVINMTRELSFLAVDFSIEYDESLERVENILAEELPKLKERLPAIKDGPYYRGVAALGDNSVDIRISMQCREADRIQLERDVNREMKLIFDKHDVSIPYAQVVVHQPEEHEGASYYERLKAEQFVKEQKQESKDYHDDSGN